MGSGPRAGRRTFELCELLETHGAMTTGQLAEKLETAQSNVCRICDDAVAMGLIGLMPGPTGGRYPPRSYTVCLGWREAIKRPELQCRRSEYRIELEPVAANPWSGISNVFAYGAATGSES